MANIGPIAATAHTWQEVREEILRLNAPLVEIVDRIAPGDEIKMYRVKYRYGDKILDKGRFYLPDINGGFVELSESLEPKTLAEDIGYNLYTNPVMIPLQNTMELYIEVEGRVVPFAVVQPGNVFGLSRILDEIDSNHLSHTSKSLWDMTAGARSVFMLPKISDNMAHTRLLKHFGFNIEKPRELIDHWQVFKQLAKARDFIEPWEFEVLLLPKQWFEHLNDPAWRELKIFFLQKNRQSHSFWLNVAAWQMTFSRIQHLKHIKASPHMIDTVRHLFVIASGVAPGFRPAIESSMAPVKGIQAAYIDYYDIAYKPIIMAPYMLDITDHQAAYYSLQYPTSIEYSPKSSGGTSTINDLDELTTLMRKYLSQLVNPDLNLENTILERLGKCLRVEYFHTNPNQYESILSADNIAAEDADFNKLLYETDRPLDFARNSSFVKGCIKLQFDNSAIGSATTP